MILKGDEDLRVQKTIDAIYTAFKAMICEMDFKQMTVKELCERARINKKTFYRYYLDLYDLMAEMQQTMSADYLKKIQDCRIPEELDVITREFFEFCAGSDPAYEKITCSGGYESIRDDLIEKNLDYTRQQSGYLALLDEPHQKILLRFIRSSTIEIYKEWVADGKKIPLDEIIEIAITLICTGTDQFMKQYLPPM